MAETLDHYVYVLFDERGQPFYVGMGRGARWCHRGGRSSRDAVVNRLQASGFEVPRVKVAENLSRIQAAEIEIALIAAIGRWPDGPLVNASNGGDGVAGIKANWDGRKSVCSMSGRTHSQATIDKMRASALAHVTQEQRERFLRIQCRNGGFRGRRHSDEAKARVSAAKRGAKIDVSARKGRPLPEATRAKISAKIKAVWQARRD